MSEDFFARQKLMLDEETGAKIKKARILVIGAGAGGNEVLKNLALMGFGNFSIVDFDPIEPSNLSRTTLFSREDIGKPKAEIAAEALKKITLHETPLIIGINSKIQDIGLQIFNNNDIVISCVDTMDARAYINDWCVKLKKPFFEMGFERFTIQVTFFPNELPTDSCLREVIGNADFLGTRQSCSKLKVHDVNLHHIPTIQVAAAFAGVFIATEIILFLQGKSALKNKILQYAADYHNCSIYDVPQSINCHQHENVTYSAFNSNFNVNTTVRELLNKLKQEFNNDYYLKFSSEYIYSIECEGCKKEIFIKRDKTEVYDNERWCDDCTKKGLYTESPINSKWKIVSELNLFNKNHVFYLDLCLSDFNFKNHDILIAHNLYQNEDKVFVFIN